MPENAEIAVLARLVRPWTLCDDGGRFDHGSEQAAAAVLASDWLAERERAAVESSAWYARVVRDAKAEALREAADAPWEPSHAAGHQWLRDRADRLYTPEACRIPPVSTEEAEV